MRYCVLIDWVVTGMYMSMNARCGSVDSLELNERCIANSVLLHTSASWFLPTEWKIEEQKLNHGELSAHARRLVLETPCSFVRTCCRSQNYRANHPTVSLSLQRRKLETAAVQGSFESSMTPPSLNRDHSIQFVPQCVEVTHKAVNCHLESLESRR
jgi:hypothetical protein